MVLCDNSDVNESQETTDGVGGELCGMVANGILSSREQRREAKALEAQKRKNNRCRSTVLA